MTEHPTHPTNQPLVLGISATRQSGKDTLVGHILDIDPRCYRVAFADRLKRDVAPLIREEMGFNPDNLTPEQKEIVRPLWIGWGMAQRARDPLHWVKIVTREIQETWKFASQAIPACADFRFCNEVAHFRDTFGPAFVLINLTREGAPPPTDEEEKHYRQVAAMADYHLNWGNNTKEERLEIAHQVLTFARGQVQARSERKAA